jgi:spoIIIJ-associated protein
MSNQIEFEGRTEADAVSKAVAALGVTADHLDYSLVDEGSSGILGLGARPARIRVRVPAPAAAAPVVAEPSAPVPAPVAAEPAPAASSEGGDSDDEERAGGIVGPAPEKAAKAVEVATTLVQKMGLEAVITMEDREREIVVELKDVEGRTALVDAFAGSRPPALPSFQFLLNKVVNRFPEGRKHVSIVVPGLADRQPARRPAKAEVPAETVAAAEPAEPTPPPPLPADVDPIIGALARTLAEKARLTGRVYTIHPMSPADRRSMHLAIEGLSGVHSVSDGEGAQRRLHIGARGAAGGAGGAAGSGNRRRRRRRRRGGRGAGEASGGDEAAEG